MKLVYLNDVPYVAIRVDNENPIYYMSPDYETEDDGGSDSGGDTPSTNNGNFSIIVGNAEGTYYGYADESVFGSTMGSITKADSSLPTIATLACTQGMFVFTVANSNYRNAAFAITELSTGIIIEGTFNGDIETQQVVVEAPPELYNLFVNNVGNELSFMITIDHGGFSGQ